MWWIACWIGGPVLVSYIGYRIYRRLRRQPQLEPGLHPLRIIEISPQIEGRIITHQ